MSVTKVTGMMSTGTKGGDIPSASTLVIDTDGDYFDITGTTGITAMTVDVGRRFTLQFDGALTLTHGSSLYLPGATNFTTEANDCLSFIATAANTVRCTGYALKDGGSPVVPSAVTDVKFLVYPASSGTNVTGAGTLYTAVYGTEVYDTANAFDGTSTFTAPETGKYLFTASVLFSGVTSAGDGYDIQLVTSNRTYQTSHNTTNALGNQPHQMFSVIADMDSSDTAMVKILGTGESSNVWDFEGGLNNSFSGALLA